MRRQRGCGISFSNIADLHKRGFSSFNLELGNQIFTRAESSRVDLGACEVIGVSEQKKGGTSNAIENDEQFEVPLPSFWFRREGSRQFDIFGLTSAKQGQTLRQVDSYFDRPDDRDGSTTSMPQYDYSWKRWFYRTLVSELTSISLGINLVH